MNIQFPKIPITIQGMDLVHLPKMVKIRQIYDSERIEDLGSWIVNEMEEKLSNKEDFRGKNICITVGSRGIPDLDLITKTIIDQLKAYGANPFIIPAMGSHGGGTAEGQKEYLAGYNITEETMGVPIKSSMEVVEIGQLQDGTPVYCDKYAYNSDGIVVMNKVKPHTDFRGKHESGLAKMMAIGIAKHKGASMFHSMGFSTFADRIPQVCDVFLENAPIAFGVGIVQNAYDHISEFEIIPNDKILERDEELLKIAKQKIADFKIDNIDLLIIDEIGKNISGNGHDPNVVGRSNSPGFDNIINIKKLFIRGLTPETHFNACGINHADVTTRRVLNEVDFSAMWTNVATATMLNGGKIPIYVETDKEAIQLALKTCNGIDYDHPRVARIKNTLEMEEIEVSEAFLDEIKDNPEVEVLSEPHEMHFDAEGFLMDEE